MWGLCWQGAFTARVDLDRAACRAFERAVFRNPAVGLTAAEDGTAPRVRDQASADEEDQPLLTTPPATRVPRLCRRRLCVVSPSSCPNEPVNVTASSNSFSRSRWIIRPRSSPASRPRSHRRSPIRSFASSSRSIAGVRVPRRGTLTTASGLLRSSALPHSLADPKGGQPSLSCALQQPDLSQPDYPKVQPLVRSTFFRRSQVGAASTPWSPAPHRTNRRAP